jgi:hypothetical protein
LRSLLTALLLAIAFTPSQIATAQTAKAPTRKPAASARSSATVPARSAAPAAVTPAANTTPCNCPAATPPRTYTPYIAKQQSTRVQTLADGTTITSVTQAQMWRDASGRTRTETTSTPSVGTVTRFVTVYDPVARVRYSWNVGAPISANIVTVYRYPQPVHQAAAPATPASARRYYPNKNESLPPQTIAGIYVEGYRNSRTIPAGYEGNNRDMTTVNEYWTAPDLSITLRSVTDDPRSGKITTEITDLQQTAPDPTVFELPQGYTVRESNPQ